MADYLSGMRPQLENEYTNMKNKITTAPNYLSQFKPEMQNMYANLKDTANSGKNYLEGYDTKVEGMYGQLLQARQNALQNGYNQQAQQINTNIERAKPVYQGQMSGVSYNNAMQKKGIAEALANMGILGGNNITSNLRADLGAQNNINALQQQLNNYTADQNTAKLNAQKDLTSQLDTAAAETNQAKIQQLMSLAKAMQEQQNWQTGLNVGIGQNEIGSMLGLTQGQQDQSNWQLGQESGLTQAKLAQLLSLAQAQQQQDNFEREFANSIYQNGIQNSMQEAGLTGQYKGQQTMQAQQLAEQLKQQEFQNKLSEAGLTGYYKGSRTMDMQNFDFNKAMQEAGLLGEYNGAPTMDKQRLNESIRQFDTGQQNWQQEMTLKERQMQIQSAAEHGRLSAQQAQLALSKAKWEAENDPNSLDNQYKKAQVDALNKKNAIPDYGGYTDYIDKLYISKDPFTGSNMVDQSGVGAYIKNLEDNGVDEKTIDALLMKYGLPTGK